jgi:hypothetical protein
MILYMIIIGLSVTLQAAYGATTGTLLIKGTVPQILEITVNPEPIQIP